MLHCGGKIVTEHELGSIELPPETETYMPVAHTDLKRLAEERVRRELNYDGEMDWTHAVNKQGRQYFGVCKMPGIEVTERQCLQMGLRNSLDKSMAGAVAFGALMFICDNLMFSGNLVTMFRKHTKNIMNDLRALLLNALDDVVENVAIQARRVEGWERVDCSQDEGYKYLGLARGRGLLPPTIANIAFREWQQKKQSTFAGRNAFSLYNAVTEAMKVVAPSRALKTYTGIHKFFGDEVVVGLDRNDLFETL